MEYSLYKGSHRSSNNWLLIAIGLVLLLGSVVAVMLWQNKSFQLLSVQSASMEPAIKSGDAILIASKSNIKAGDIVTYRSPADPKVLVTHRVVKIDELKNLITTKGDNETSADPVFGSSLLVGKVIKIFPGTGPTVNKLFSPVGVLAAVYIPALAVVAIEVRNVRLYYKTPYQIPNSSL
jgi:signal peptidase I